MSERGTTVVCAGATSSHIENLEETEVKLSAYWWFSRYVIAAMLVDGKRKIAH